MYKIFLCFRYLRSKAMPYLAVLGVALCVWLLLSSVSVMSGFLNKIESAAKGLFGDIVIESAGERGIAFYDEFIREITAKDRGIAEIEAAEPFILSFGMLRVEGDRNFRQHVQIAGIRLPGRADVSDFEDGLFVQANIAAPTFDPSLKKVIAAIERQQQLMRKIVQREFAPQLEKLSPAKRKLVLEHWTTLHYLSDPNLSPEKKQLLRQLANAGLLQNEALLSLHSVKKRQAELETLQAELAKAEARKTTETELDELREAIDDIIEATGMEQPAYRVILGLGIPGLSFRTEKSETVRYLVPGHRIILYVFPLGKRFSPTDISPNIHKFSIIDDSCSGVSSIDNKLIYVPFKTLQKMNNMAGEYDAENPNVLVSPARCSQIHVKVRGKRLSERELRKISAEVQRAWLDFQQRNPQATLTPVSIDTWRQRQVQVIGPIEKQRTLVAIILGFMSIVAVTLIFVILYTIVVQKTREIGLLKAVGASSRGVAGLFFLYGVIISLVGAILGTVGGYYTVKNINTIQDWADELFGLRVFTRQTHMFAKIPNDVDWTATWIIMVSSIAVGLIGALLPAIRAARMQPVEALRYE
ncbi:MAG: FtsX-like permease family protein [Phycisphaerae bacterium]|nr:FtsX-like permease family protein [Phycisphaerae bacterium]